MVKSRKSLSLINKIKIIELIKKGVSYQRIKETFSVSKSVISRIKKSEEMIITFAGKTVKGCGKRKRLTKAEFPRLENRILKWFLLQREKNISVSGKMLQLKATEIHKALHDGTSFTASTGWLHNFKRRHGIRQLKICGEKLSSDNAAVIPFKSELQKKMSEMDITFEQV